MIEKEIVSECNVESLVASVMLGVISDHRQGANGVAKGLNGLTENFPSIGFVDKDKRLDGYFDQFLQEPIENYVVNTKCGISLFKHPKKSQYLVLSYPAMDMVLFELCRRHSLHKLDFKTFKVRSKRVLRNDPMFTNWVNTLCQKKDSVFYELKAKLMELRSQNVKPKRRTSR
ncbi:MAG: hypothetical protein JNM00_10580 [Flavobacteriales bacterium]|nr:hypothetical protein [Flavobacteriales bacterium]